MKPNINLNSLFVLIPLLFWGCVCVRGGAGRAELFQSIHCRRRTDDACQTSATSSRSTCEPHTNTNNQPADHHQKSKWIFHQILELLEIIKSNLVFRNRLDV